MARILLFGIYKLGFRSLEALLERGMDVVGVVTKPDPQLDRQPLVCLARERGLPVLAPERPSSLSFFKEVRRLRPDLIAVTGYHKILPARLIALPPRGVINMHGSLLPRHRGPVPWKWSLLNGETTTGMTIQMMSVELDRGPVLSQQACEILPDDTGETLFARLCGLAGPLLTRTVEEHLAGRLNALPQDEREATYEGNPTEEDARISWDWDAERIHNRIRGLSPRPGAWTLCRGMKLRIRLSHVLDEPSTRRPGVIVRHRGASVVVSTGRGQLSVGDISVEGAATPLGLPRIRSLGLVPGAILGGPAPSGLPRPVPGPMIG